MSPNEQKINFISRYIKSSYGSKRGLLNYVKFKALYLLGKYNHYKKIDFTRVERLVFVCYGNICRSSLGECYAKSLGIESVSFGIRCKNDKAADPRAIAYAKKIGLSLSGHKTQNIAKYEAKHSDLVVVMEPSHLFDTKEVMDNVGQITIAPLWGKASNVYLHDPYNSCSHFFERCENRVIEAVDILQLKFS